MPVEVGNPQDMRAQRRRLPTRVAYMSVCLAMNAALIEINKYTISM